MKKYYLKLPALLKYCTEPMQTYPNNQYWNDNKPVLKITSVLNLSNHQKWKTKKALIWNIRLYTALGFH